MPTPPILTAAQVTAAIAAALGPEYSARIWSKGGFLRIYLRKLGPSERMLDLGYFVMSRGVLDFMGDDKAPLAKVLDFFKASAAVPPLGARFLKTQGRTARRVWELVESLPLGTTATEQRHACDRHTLRCVEESGFTDAESTGVGSQMHVEDAWFIERTDMKRVR